MSMNGQGSSTADELRETHTRETQEDIGLAVLQDVDRDTEGPQEP